MKVNTIRKRKAIRRWILLLALLTFIELSGLHSFTIHQSLRSVEKSYLTGKTKIVEFVHAPKHFFKGLNMITISENKNSVIAACHKWSQISGWGSFHTLVMDLSQITKSGLPVYATQVGAQSATVPYFHFMFAGRIMDDSIAKIEIVWFHPGDSSVDINQEISVIQDGFEKTDGPENFVLFSTKMYSAYGEQAKWDRPELICYDINGNEIFRDYIDSIVSMVGGRL